MTPEDVQADTVGRQLRQTMGHYPTGVTIVTATDRDEHLAMVMGSFGSVSLTPPLVQFLPMRTGTTWPRVERTGKFSVNLLSHDQLRLCKKAFAKDPNLFDSEPWMISEHGLPHFTGCMSWVDCAIDTVIPAGDHFIVLGQVLDIAQRNELLPLVFCRGGYGTFLTQRRFVEEDQLPTDWR